MGIRLSMPKMHTDQKINCFLIVIVIKEPDIFAAEPKNANKIWFRKPSS